MSKLKFHVLYKKIIINLFFKDKTHLVTSDINWIRDTLKKLTHSLAKIIRKIKTYFNKNINWKQMKKIMSYKIILPDFVTLKSMSFIRFLQ